MWWVALLLATQAEDYSDRWLVITRTETAAAPGTIDTTPYGAIRPGLYVEVASAHADEAGALSACDALRPAKECYVRFAGRRHAPVTAQEAAAAFTGKQVNVFELELRGRKVPLVIVFDAVERNEDCAGFYAGAVEAHLFWSKKPQKLGAGDMKRNCCKKPAFARTPAELAAVRVDCEQVGGHMESSFVALVPAAEPERGSALATSCNRYPHAVPEYAVMATCDRVTLTPKQVEVRRLAGKIDPCPKGQEGSGSLFRKETVTELAAGVLRTREGAWKPFMETDCTPVD